MANIVSAATAKRLFAASKGDAAVSVRIGEIDGQDVVMEVKRYLGLKEFGLFVGELAEAEFSGDEYVPQGAKILFDFAMVRHYTNVSLPEGDIETRYAMIQQLGLVDKIKVAIDRDGQYWELVKAVEDAQRHEREQRSGLNGLLGSLKRAVDGFDIGSMLEQLKGFSPDQLQSLGELREIAKAFDAHRDAADSADKDAGV